MNKDVNLASLVLNDKWYTDIFIKSVLVDFKNFALIICWCYLWLWMIVIVIHNKKKNKTREL